MKFLYTIVVTNLEENFVSSAYTVKNNIFLQFTNHFSIALSQHFPRDYKHRRIILIALYFITCKQAQTFENQVGVKKYKSWLAFLW